MESVMSDYTVVETIHNGSTTVIYRGRDNRGGKTVIIKALKGDYPTIKQIAGLQHEYEIVSTLHLPGVVNVYDIVRWNNDRGLALILEDFGGQSLSTIIAAQGIDLGMFFQIALALADTLQSLHQAHIIHKDLKPQNILVNPATGQVKITDFGLATRLSQETQRIGDYQTPIGTLAYMSPEQTGRMNRTIDYRTDFYSLGVTFYELLTGKLPFQSADPLELIHSHIARKPIPPHKFRPAIPVPVSDIVMKLLSKTAEERYQRAAGLKFDMQECLSQWERTGQVAAFPLGQRDIATTLHLSQKLYGRAEDLQVLLSAFECVSQGTTELLLVSGYSGIGKSALVNEIQKSVIQRRGYFITGKFDQYQRNTPYAALIRAIEDLIQQILTESEERIAFWKEQITAALGSNGQVITEVLPEIEVLIGPQSAVPSLGPLEAQSRFHMTMQNFMGVFSNRDHPLVLFLDDMQWSDLASLQLLHLLVTDPVRQCLLVICAYRDNEVNPTHPLMVTLNELRKTAAIVQDIVLHPLELEHINQLLADTLACPPQETWAFAEVVLNKTGGNPFFLNQFLKVLYQEQLLWFDDSAGSWKWNLEHIQAISSTENVVEFVMGNLRKLAPETQRMLQLAACIGSQFNLHLLSVIAEQPPDATAHDLWEALQQGVILPLDAEYAILSPSADDPKLFRALMADIQVSYRFLHDRVQQAAYALIPADQTRQVHLTIGRLMLADTRTEEREETLFDIVNQLNAGSSLITHPEERLELAQLNLRAGKKAHAAAAYGPAATYFAAGMNMLPEEGWHTHYALTLALHENRAVCEYLNGHIATAEMLFSELLLHVISDLERANIHVAQLNLYASLGRFTEGLAIGLEGLRMFGINFPTVADQQQVAVREALEDIAQNLGDRQVEDLLHAPALTYPDKQAALRLLMQLVPISFHSSPSIYMLVICEMVNISLQYGNTPESCFGYVMYGSYLASVAGDYEMSYAFGKLATDLSEKLKSTELIHKVYHVFGGFIDHWRNHVRSSISYLKQAYLASLDVGDMSFAGYASMSVVSYGFWAGMPLQELYDDLQKYLDFLRQTKNMPMEITLVIFQQAILNLQGLTRHTTSLSDDNFDEAQAWHLLEEQQLFSLINGSYIAKALILFIHEHYAEALETMRAAERTADHTSGVYCVGETVFHTALILVALYPTATAEQPAYWQEIERCRDQLKIWAANCPDTFHHKYLLVAAEMARLTGATQDATDLYDQAIVSAEKQGFVRDAAIANESAARHYLTEGKTKFARVYLLDACQGYLTWGATAKAQTLIEKYPALLSGIAPVALLRGKQQSSTRPSSSSSSHIIYSSAGLFDITTVIKASQAIASEIVMEKLLDRLMAILLENAGAQKGGLILDRDGRLIVEAIATTDDEIATHPMIPVDMCSVLSGAIVHYVARTRKQVVLQDATSQNQFSNDPYLRINSPKSILCMPLIHQNHLSGVLYLENNLTTDAFSPERVELLSVIALQGAIAIENALLYQHVHQMTDYLQQMNERLEEANRSLESKVTQRTAELSQANDRLQWELHERERIEAERARLQGEMIRMQQQIISELSTPLIPITDQIVVMPLIGSLDTQRAQDVLTILLDGVEARRAQIAIIDITGVTVVDTSVARVLINAAQSVRLLGAQTIITGIRPSMAGTLVTLGVDLTGILTTGTLQQGITLAMRQLPSTGKSRRF